MLEKEDFFLILSLLGIIMILFLSNHHQDSSIIIGTLNSFSYHESYSYLDVESNGTNYRFVCFSCSSNIEAFMGHNVSLLSTNNSEGDLIVDKLEVLS